MIKTLLTTLLFSITSISVTNCTKVNKSNNEIELLKVSENDFYNLSKNEINPIIYINKDFGKDSLNSGLYFKKSNINVSITAEEDDSDTEIEEAEQNLELAATYDFEIDGINYNGDIYANKDDDISFVENKANEIIEQINNGTFFEGHNIENSKAKLRGNFTKSSNWKLLDERKKDMVCTYNNEKFGDFSEWQSIFLLGGTLLNTEYYAFVNESYIKPNEYKTNYRTDDLIYKFDPTLGAKIELRDYGPKMKNPSATIGYSVSAGSEVTSDGGASISSNISTSYSTLVESPKVYDNGNMLNNYVEIRFDYLQPFANSNQFYEYNISQTYQSSSYIIKANKSTEDIICHDDRNVIIVRDGVWSNKRVSFNYNTKLTIVR